MDVFLFNTVYAPEPKRFWVTNVPWATRVGQSRSRYMLPFRAQHNNEDQSPFSNEFHNNTILYGRYSATGRILCQILYFVECFLSQILSSWIYRGVSHCDFLCGMGQYNQPFFCKGVCTALRTFIPLA